MSTAYIGSEVDRHQWMTSHEEIIETNDVSELTENMTVPRYQPAQAEHCTDLRPDSRIYRQTTLHYITLHENFLTWPK